MRLNVYKTEKAGVGVGVGCIQAGLMRNSRLQGIADRMSDGRDLLNKAPASLTHSHICPAQKYKEQIEIRFPLLISQSHLFSVHFRQSGSISYSRLSDTKTFIRTDTLNTVNQLCVACMQTIH